MFRRLFLPLLLLFAAGRGDGPLCAGELQRGLPLVVNHAPEEYNADAQNWAAVQDARGLLYVANTLGVLEFDGEEWQLIKVGANLAARSLAVDAQGRVYVGAMGDFGMLKADASGRMQYTSLAVQGRLGSADVGDVVTAVAGAGGVFFQSAQGVFLVAGGRVQAFRPASSFHLGFAVHDRFYVRERGRGLLVFQDGRLVPVDGGERFKEDRVFCMLPRPGGEILLGAQAAGFLLFRPGTTGPSRFEKAQGFAGLEKTVAGQKVSVCDRLPDGRIVLGTAQSGLYVCHADGAVLCHLDKAHGLQDNGVYYVYVDPQGNVVACLNVGISVVEFASPFSFLDGRSGLSGAGAAAHLRRAVPRDRLFLGTSQGLFYRDAGDSTFTRVPGSQETWAIQDCRGQLLVCQGNGLAAFRDGRLDLLLPNQVCVSMLSPRARPDILLVGTLGRGVTVLQFEGGAWRVKGPVPGFTQSAFNLSEESNGTVWLQTQTSDGLFRLRFSTDYARAEVRNYTTAEGLPANDRNIPFQGRGRVFFATASGFYRYRIDLDAFVPDPRFPETTGLERPIQSVSEDRKGRVLMLSRDLVGRYVPGMDGRLALDRDRLPRLRSLRPGDFSTELEDGSILMGFKDGFILEDRTWVEPVPAPYRASIRRVDNPEWSLQGGAWNLRGELEGTGPFVLPYRANMIRFGFAAQGAKGTEYSYSLDGFDGAWSPWKRQLQSAYTNLPEGRYVFRVKARNVFGDVSQESRFAFQVLAPWFRTWLAYLGYVALGAFVVAGSAKLYGRHLVKEKERLEALVAEKTQELKEATLTDPLTNLRNRRFVAEVVVPELRTFVSFKEHLARSPEQRMTDAGRAVFGIFLFDLDHFKAVNDTYGHEAGDLVLRQFSGILKGLVREDDFVIRWGGEEFLIFLKKAAPEYLAVFAEKARRAVQEFPFVISEKEQLVIHRTVSIGYVALPFDEGEPAGLGHEQLVMLADLGLNHAKKHGRDRAVRICPGEHPLREQNRDHYLASLEASLEAGYLKLA